MTEYQRNLIRLWDSLRENAYYMGDLSCKGVTCYNCPFRKICNDDKLTLCGADKAIEIVNNWVKEHPVKTEPNDDLIDAANKLKSYCNEKPICRCCTFYITGQGCGIKERPDKWFYDKFEKVIHPTTNNENEEDK